ncbi:MAG: anaerobic ribonucleoside-triphosphate reductase activating protein [Clostridia bacterium]|nr:anaerobic ribonucleoside-triphosphate reductase activating protein [Clostridia bacterium]
MQIAGFQKLTALDFPNRVACIVFTKGCNFRCPFCHNASLVTHTQDAENLNEEEILEYLEKRKGILDGVVVTGGEPLVQNDIEDFLKKVKALGYEIKLDTNGTFPEKLISLVNSGLVDYVAMDIKNCKEKYSETAGVNNINYDDIQKSIDFLLCNLVDYEFRTTVVNELHTIQDIAAIARSIKGAEKYFLQNFVDSGDVIGDNLSSVSTKTLHEMCAVSTKFVKKCEIR